MGIEPSYEWLKITVVGDSAATVAYTSVEGEMYVASAKRASSDKYDEDIGYQLAVARLLGKISRRFERQATAAVHDADQIRRGKLRRRARTEAHVTMRLSESLGQLPREGRHRRKTDPLYPFR